MNTIMLQNLSLFFCDLGRQEYYGNEMKVGLLSTGVNCA